MIRDRPVFYERRLTGIFRKASWRALHIHPHKGLVEIAMFKKLIAAISIASAAMTGLAATPALAQNNYHYSERYEGDDGSYYRSETYRSDDYDRGYYDRGYRGYDRPVEYREEYVRERPRYHRARYANCSSGTTGTIIGGVLGGLLGREIGRGGRWDRPSTTGLILGAGAGALAGRAVEQGDCR